MRRHIYTPLLGRGWSNQCASIMVFTFSAILHELLVGVPTHNIIGVAFAGMIFQIPLIAITVPLEKVRGQGSIIGNAIFWYALHSPLRPCSYLRSCMEPLTDFDDTIQGQLLSGWAALCCVNLLLYLAGEVWGCFEDL